MTELSVRSEQQLTRRVSTLGAAMRKDYRAQIRLMAEWFMEGEFKFGVDPAILFHALQTAAASDRGLMCKQLKAELLEAELVPFLNALTGYKNAKHTRKQNGMS